MPQETPSLGGSSDRKRKEDQKTTVAGVQLVMDSRTAHPCSSCVSERKEVRNTTAAEERGRSDV